ncbi:MAG TPA: hypothetical protein VHB98_22315 [Chloroflexota bacterium]|jgi:hypothetical protein|nr:hypothetical protein [Chloroflexota bacterium]
MLVAMMLITRCALTLAVLGVLVLPFTLTSRLSLVVDLCGIAFSLALVVLTFYGARWTLQRSYRTD